ncbi:protein ABHD15-like [Saccostrea echinata]|uniref:protein ABHD15-like n=1 Tax=Saccostrea echinata TaxID=191078 RepID=UPI002A827A05|nr:protein ABHD15-like [Saccostrea echinata]XP_061197061.1 protein ABHD15-like [Saccostrea echinata]XP_061197063.1 protein ABHD15-like [Saccostrea echinata]
MLVTAGICTFGTIFEVSVISLVIYLCYNVFKHFLETENKPTLFYKESRLNEYLIRQCTNLKKPFRPAVWARNAHIQSFLGLFIQRNNVIYDREYLQLTDKGIVALDWCRIPDNPQKRTSPIVIVLPGQADDKKGVRTLCSKACGEGYRVVVINSRGHGSSYLATCKFQSYGDPTDLRQCVMYINRKFPKANITAIGVGSGSTVLFSYLGEFGSSTRLKAAAFISPPYEIDQDYLKDVPKFYQFVVLCGLKITLLRHSKALTKSVNLQSAFSSWNLLQYVEMVYCNPLGYSSMEDFLEKNNPLRDVDDIAIPVMCINSQDDPVCQQEHIPFDIFNYYPNMLLVSTKHGGHCGFWEGGVPESWSASLVLEYLSTVLDFTLNNNRDIDGIK